jgi:hypothetical protein
MSDDQETPRPAKRRRDLDETFHLSPTPSSRSQSTASVTSHRSGRLSPVKQIEALKDLERPVIFCDFDSGDADSERSDVAAMRKAAQMLADGVGILDYVNADIFKASIDELPSWTGRDYNVHGRKMLAKRSTDQRLRSVMLPASSMMRAH